MVPAAGTDKAKDITPSIAWRRGMERGSTRLSSLKGRERAVVSETNIGTPDFKVKVGETSERRGGAHMGFSELIDTILN